MFLILVTRRVRLSPWKGINGLCGTLSSTFLNSPQEGRASAGAGVGWTSLSPLSPAENCKRLLHWASPYEEHHLIPARSAGLGESLYLHGLWRRFFQVSVQAESTSLRVGWEAEKPVPQIPCRLVPQKLGENETMDFPPTLHHLFSVYDYCLMFPLLGQLWLFI